MQHVSDRYNYVEGKLSFIPVVKHIHGIIDYWLVIYSAADYGAVELYFVLLRGFSNIKYKYPSVKLNQHLTKKQKLSTIK